MSQLTPTRQGWNTLFHFSCIRTLYFPSPYTQGIHICCSETFLNSPRLTRFSSHAADSPHSPRDDIYFHHEISASTTSGHTDHYLLILSWWRPFTCFFQTICWISPYSQYAPYCHSGAHTSYLQCRKKILSILLPALLRVQKNLQIIFLSWALFYWIPPSPKRVTTALQCRFLYLLATLW